MRGLRMKAPAILTAALLAAFTLSAAAQKMQTPAGEAPGPWLLGTIGVGKNADGTVQTTALKGLAIKVGEHGEAAVAYDLDLCRMAGAWTGKFTTPMNLMSRGEYPVAMGEVAFTTGSVAGFISGEAKAPWKDQLLHLSYGTCSLFGVMKEEVANATGRDGTPLPSAGERSEAVSALSRSRTGTESRPYPPSALVQGGVTRFPVNFQSGTMRARFNPADGQLYIVGLRGWQTTGVKNGAFQRVRYNPRAPVRMPIGLHATKRGVRLDFTCALDAASAGDPQNWNIEVWNYLWSSAYGSPEISTLGGGDKPAELGKDGAMQFTNAQLGQKKHDPLTVKSAVLSADKKSVFLEIPGLKPVMQMQIKFALKSADGAELQSEVLNTIHALGE